MSNDVDPVGRPVDYERSHSERLDQQARIVGPFTRDIGSGNGHVALIAADFVGPAGEVISSFGLSLSVPRHTPKAPVFMLGISCQFVQGRRQCAPIKPRQAAKEFAAVSSSSSRCGRVSKSPTASCGSPYSAAFGHNVHSKS